ncbi:50S ribosomal protein L10 [Candidatus Dependentiae bacterium]
MNRQEKTVVVENLKKDLLSSEAAFLVVYRGLNVEKMQQLRSDLRSKGGFLKVAKARLMKRAVEGEDGICDLSEFFKDQVGVVFAKEEVADVAKVLSDFSKENKALDLVAGYFDSQVVAKDKIAQIASLPPKDVLLAQLCGTLNAPIAGLARVLNMVVLKMLFALKQIGEQKKNQ